MALVSVYGTLTEEAQVDTLCETYQFREPARCVGLQRREGRYPTLVPGRSVTGRLLAVGDLTRLDRYEGVDRGLYRRVSIPLAASLATTVSATAAAVYIGEPTALGIGSLDTHWPGDGSFAERVERYVSTAHIERINTTE